MLDGDRLPYNQPMDSLRWILLAIGLVALGAIYFFGSRAEKRRHLGLEAPGGGAARARIDPTIDLSAEGDSEATMARRSSASVDEDLQTLSDLVAEHRGAVPSAPREPEVDLTLPKPPPPEEDDDPRPNVQLSSNYDRIVSLMICAKTGRHMSGHALSKAAEKAGLVFGRLDIYHRLLETAEGKELIFSMVNMEKPGTFSNDPLENFTTPGVNLFMTLPGPLSALDTWDSMLTTGQRLAELLDAELLDETQSHLTRQTIAHAREQMREYDRQRDYAT